MTSYLKILEVGQFMQGHCTILGLPLQAGTGRGGCLMGPDAFRTAGLGEVITSQGRELRDLGNLPFPTYIPEVVGPEHLKKLPEIVDPGYKKTGLKACYGGYIPHFYWRGSLNGCRYSYRRGASC